MLNEFSEAIFRRHQEIRWETLLEREATFSVHILIPYQFKKSTLFPKFPFRHKQWIFRRHQDIRLEILLKRESIFVKTTRKLQTIFFPHGWSEFFTANRCYFLTRENQIRHRILEQNRLFQLTIKNSIPPWGLKWRCFQCILRREQYFERCRAQVTALE